MSKETKKSLTAVQRLDALEAGLNMVDQALGSNQGVLDRLTSAITLLSKKLEAVRRAVGVADEVIAGHLLEIDIEDLKGRVEDMKKAGVLVDASEVQATTSFIVARELDSSTKEIAQHRIQFPLFSQSDDVKKALAGSKVGDIVTVVEGKNLVEVLEIYDVVIPKPQPTDGQPTQDTEVVTDQESSTA